MHSGVQDETVDAPIPGNIDEPDEAGSGECADIGQTPLKHRPELAFNVILPRGGEEFV
jgi:hypothetical protein